jgi:hypothetical protein
MNYLITHKYQIMLIVSELLPETDKFKPNSISRIIIWAIKLIKEFIWD